MNVHCARVLIFGSLVTALIGLPSSAQTFSSGSTGADRDLTYTTPGVYTFNPKDPRFNPPLDPDGDGVFNFTTITIGAGVTLRLAGDVYAPPVIWLASGAVKIDGIIDASGQTGFSAANTTQRTNTVPGSGGYGGGYPAVGQNTTAGSGLGPGGGQAPSNGCDSRYSNAGVFTGNQFLIPLIGGSGGGGSSQGHAGGAGGGAILIASSLSISGSGSIKANGGDVASGFAGVGAGGAIRLVAPSVTLTGILDVTGGPTNSNCGGIPSSASNGSVRIEAFQIGQISARGPLYSATPFGLFINASGTPSVRVVSVGGNTVAASPTGTFTVPDVTVSSGAALPVVIQASNVPIGTIVTLVIFSENGPDQTIQSPPLAGSLASSTATATVTLPPGFSKGFVKASF